MICVPQRYLKPFHESANEPHLVHGMEPRLFMVAVGAPFLIALTQPNRYGFLSAAALFCFLRGVFRYLAKKEPRLTQLYREALAYRPFYPALPMQEISMRKFESR